MGFTCGFYKIKKYKDFTMSDFDTVAKYVKYNTKAGEWARKHYKTAYEYATVDGSRLTEEEIKEALIELPEEDARVKEINGWVGYSGYSFIHDILKNDILDEEHAARLEKEGAVELSSTQIISLIKRIKEHMSFSFPKCGNLTGIFKIMSENILGGEEANVFKTVEIDKENWDGVEIETETGTERLFFEDDCAIYSSESRFDYELYQDVVDVLLDALEESLKGDCKIFYSGGW